MIDFYLVPHKVEEKQGSALPTQYKLVYFKPSATKEEASREELKSFDLPLDALAQLTFEQCFCYYNWQGAIKIPAVLQCGDKLSTLVGEHIQESVNMVELQNHAMKDL